jgi:hypothetical protein
MASVRRVKYALADCDPALAARGTVDKPKLCYQWNRQFVEESNLLIAEASYPSIGLGIEIEIAERKKIPIVYLFRGHLCSRAHPMKYINPGGKTHELQIGEGSISLMALGVPSVEKVIKYENAGDAVVQLASDIERRTRWAK